MQAKDNIRRLKQVAGGGEPIPEWNHDNWPAWMGPLYTKHIPSDYRSKASAFASASSRLIKEQEAISKKYKSGELTRDEASQQQAALQNKIKQIDEIKRVYDPKIQNLMTSVWNQVEVKDRKTGRPISMEDYTVVERPKQLAAPTQDPLSFLKNIKSGTPINEVAPGRVAAFDKPLARFVMPAEPAPGTPAPIVEPPEATPPVTQSPGNPGVTPSPGTPGVTPSPGTPGIIAPPPGTPGIVAPPPERDDDPLPEPPVDEEPVEEGEPVPISQNIIDIMPQGIEKTGMIEVDPGISREMITARGINPQLLVNQAVAQARQQAGPTQRNLLGGAGRGMSSDVGTFSRHALGPLAQSLLGGRQSMLRIPWEQQLKYADDVRKREQLAHDLGLKQAMLTGKDWYRRYQEQLDEQRLRNQILMGIINPLIGNLYS